MSNLSDADDLSVDELIEWVRKKRAQDCHQPLSELLAAARVTPQRMIEIGRLVDLACIDLMQRRRLGSDARVEDYTKQFPQLRSESFLLDLIDAELCVTKELRQTPDEQDYRKRFPGLADKISHLLHLPEPSGFAIPSDSSQKPFGMSSARDFSVDASEDGRPVAANNLPQQLGGYRILRLLGRGAMGAVYEARQISLNRLVALKTIRDRIAHQPATLARFTREAYSAAQLSHHNIVQIYDFGEDRGRYFFSMERVAGGTLNDLIRKHGAIEPRLAAGYALQVARGLRYAHRHGLVHRDIKPANLLLTQDGVVKIADLGLVKIPERSGGPYDAAPFTGSADESAGVISGRSGETEVTLEGTAVGTPAFMAPEQSLDAAAVDHRADLYSLGCTLFYLLVGRPPFEASAISGVLDQHARAAPPDLHQINPRIPDTLCRIVARAMAKRPENRFASAAEMVQALESFLGIPSTEGFQPSAKQIEHWKAIARRFNESLPNHWIDRGLLPVSLVIQGMLVLGTLTWFPSAWLWAPSSWLAATVTVLLGHRQPIGKSTSTQTEVEQHPVVVALGQWLMSLTWADWAMGALSGVVTLLLLVVTGWWVGALIGGMLGIGLGWGIQTAWLTPQRQRQAEPRQEAEAWLRELRAAGADEESLHRTVALNSGKRWPEIFESLFGYPTLAEVRDRWRDDPALASNPALANHLGRRSLRGAICVSLGHRTERNRRRRDQRRLSRIEQRGLESQGVQAGQARQQAWQIAAAVIEESRSRSQREGDAAAAIRAKRLRIKAMLADARSGKYRLQTDHPASWKVALGGQTRLAAGLVLLVVFLVWGNEIGMFDSLRQLDTWEQLQRGRVDVDAVSAALRETAAATEPEADVPPITLLGANPWSVGIAGVLLMMSAFVSGWRMTVPATIASVVILYGTTFGIPAVGPCQNWIVAAIAGMLVYVPGVIWGEETPHP